MKCERNLSRRYIIHEISVNSIHYEVYLFSTFCFQAFERAQQVCDYEIGQGTPGE